MSRLAVALAVAVTQACGEPDAPGLDAASDAASGAVAVTLLAPNGGEALTAGEDATVRWTASDTIDRTVRVDVALVDANRVVIALQRAVATPVDQPISITWAPAGVPARTSYRIRVTATNSRGQTASDESDAELTVSPPATGVSLAVHVQPIFTARCTTPNCHGAEAQVAGLNLAPGAAHASLVDVASIEAPCTSYKRVVPGQPDQSYLVFKLQGSGPCLSGVRMPKGAAALSGADLASVRDWIASGAKNN